MYVTVRFVVGSREVIKWRIISVGGKKLLTEILTDQQAYTEHKFNLDRISIKIGEKPEQTCLIVMDQQRNRSRSLESKNKSNNKIE